MDSIKWKIVRSLEVYGNYKQIHAEFRKWYNWNYTWSWLFHSTKRDPGNCSKWMCFLFFAEWHYIHKASLSPRPYPHPLTSHFPGLIGSLSSSLKELATPLPFKLWIQGSCLPRIIPCVWVTSQKVEGFPIFREGWSPSYNRLLTTLFLKKCTF